MLEETMGNVPDLHSIHLPQKLKVGEKPVKQGGLIHCNSEYSSLGELQQHRVLHCVVLSHEQGQAARIPTAEQLFSLDQAPHLIEG